MIIRLIVSGELLDEESEDEDGEGGGGDDDAEHYMQEQQARLEKEKQAILNDQTLIAEVRSNHAALPFSTNAKTFIVRFLVPFKKNLKTNCYCIFYF